MDEAGDLLTSTVSEILKGTRKYGLGLTLAHQSLAQLRDDDEVYGAVTGSCGTKVCFQVRGDDARKMAEEFGGFSAPDLRNQPPRFAIARVGPRDNAFNLEGNFIPEPPRPLDEAYAEVLEVTRTRYCTLRSSIRAELTELRRMIPPGKGSDPFAKLAEKKKKEHEERIEETGKVPGEMATLEPIDLPLDKAAEAEEVRHDPNAESIKDEIAQAAGGWGYSYKTEKAVNENTGRADIVLTLGSAVLAWEISATTSAKHEVGNLAKCLNAGFAWIFYICDVTHRRRRIEELLRKPPPAGDLGRIEFVTKRQFILRLGEIAEGIKETENPQASGVGKTALPQQTNELNSEERKDIACDAWEQISRNMKRDQKKPGEK